MKALCNALNLKYTVTASKTPNANGICERNHFITDHMLDKMLTADPKMEPELALAWSMAASNSLDTVRGRSPSQIVFGVNPNIPTLQTCGPPGMEEADVDRTIAKHIAAMHAAREEYIKSESNRTIREALKKRLYVGVEEIHPGWWIYYKQNRIWQGPVKVIAVDGKKIHAYRLGKHICINKDDVMLAKASTEIAPSSELSYLKMPSVNTSLVQQLRKEIHQGNQLKSSELENKNPPAPSANNSHPASDSHDDTEASTDSPASDESGTTTAQPVGDEYPERDVFLTI